MDNLLMVNNNSLPLYEVAHFVNKMPQQCLYDKIISKNISTHYQTISKWPKSSNNNDVFVTEHLVTLIQETIGPTGSCININNRDIVNWKGLLAKKYTSFKNIQSYRDFLIKRNDRGKVVVYHKACCYLGEYENTDLLKKDVNAGLDLKKEVCDFTYESKKMSKDLSKEKVADLVKMYNKFIDPILRPKWLPDSKVITTPYVAGSSPSSELARQHRAALKKKRCKKWPKKMA